RPVGVRDGRGTPGAGTAGVGRAAQQPDRGRVRGRGQRDGLPGRFDVVQRGDRYVRPGVPDPVRGDRAAGSDALRGQGLRRVAPAAAVVRGGAGVAVVGDAGIRVVR